MTAKVAPKIDEMVDDFRDRLDAWIVAAGQELHQEVIEVLEHVKSARTDGALDPEAEQAQCARLAASIEACSGRFEELSVALSEARANATSMAKVTDQRAGNGAAES